VTIIKGQKTMQKGHYLQFNCQGCENPICFSIFGLNKPHLSLRCSHCEKQYLIDDESLIRHLKLFEALCLQVNESQEILGNANIGIDIGEHHVKVPFKLLLTRLNSCLDLVIGDQPVSIVFRIDSLKDINPQKASQ
jgi:ribosomal protein S27E